MVVSANVRKLPRTLDPNWLACYTARMAAHTLGVLSMTLSPTHPASLIPKELLTLGESRFAAKLTVNERCQVLALRIAGMSIGAVAVTFGVNRRTVTHICNDDSPRYHAIRKIRDTMGNDAFVTKFVTEDLVDRVKEAATKPEANESYAEHDALNPERKGVPNKRATKCSGISMHKGPNHAFTHRVSVEWVEDRAGYADGWYSTLLDVEGEDASVPFGDPDQNSHLTSGTALAYAKNYCNENY